MAGVILGTLHEEVSAGRFIQPNNLPGGGKYLPKKKKENRGAPARRRGH